jgi:hypothetical protein
MKGATSCPELGAASLEMRWLEPLRSGRKGRAGGRTAAARPSKASRAASAKKTSSGGISAMDSSRAARASSRAARSRAALAISSCQNRIRRALRGTTARKRVDVNDRLLAVPDVTASTRMML